jgi:hypothetical protein
MHTTFTSYGRIEPHRQGEIIKALGVPDDGESFEDLLANLQVARRRRQ